MACRILYFIFLCLLTVIIATVPTPAPSHAPTHAPVTGAPTVATKQYARKMHYISWIENFDEGDSTDWSSDDSSRMRELKGAANADDLSERVNLQGTALNGRFPFLGRERNSLTVNSNGWIGFDDRNTLPCQYASWHIKGDANIFPTYACFQGGSSDFDTTYYGGVAVYLTDLYPAYDYPQATIKLSNTSSEDGIVLHWVNVPFYSEVYVGKSVTVHCRLRQDGHTTIYWEKFHDFTTAQCKAAKVCSKDYLIAGIRDTIYSKEGSFLTLSQAQEHAQSTIPTKVKGVYPPDGIDDIEKGKLFHACPVSDSWTLFPNRAKQSVLTNITFFAVYTSCDSEFQSYECVFTKENDKLITKTSTAHYRPGDKTESSNFYPKWNCTVPNSVLTDVDAKYVVDLRGVFSASVKTYEGNVNSISLLPDADTMDGTFTLTIDSHDNPGSLEADSCIVSNALKPALEPSGTCKKCAMTHSYQDLCMISSDSCTESILAPKNCKGTCPAPSGPVGVSYIDDTVTLMRGKVSGNYVTYSLKSQSICCDATDIDCAGECNGRRQIARTVSPGGSLNSAKEPLFDNVCCDPEMLSQDNTTCCTSPNPAISAPMPDCLGVCGGNASVDCLGYCQKWYANGTWLDCAGICGGKSFTNACGDCYNETYSGYVIGMNNSELCKAALLITNPDPYTDITTADERELAAMEALNKTGYAALQASSHLVLSSLDLSYAKRNAPEDKFTFSIPIKNERPFSLNISLSQEYQVYVSKYPTIAFLKQEIVLPGNSTSTIQVSIDASNVYKRQVTMTSNTKVLWGIKPFTIKSRPVLHDGMIATKNIETYSVVLFPVTTDCSTITSYEDCGYAPKCIFCTTSTSGRSLREESQQQQHRAMYLTYVAALRPKGKNNVEIGGFCTSGFLQESCDSILMDLGHQKPDLETMEWWLPIFLLITLGFAAALKWLSELDSKIVCPQ